MSVAATAKAGPPVRAKKRTSGHCSATKAPAAPSAAGAANARAPGTRRAARATSARHASAAETRSRRPRFSVSGTPSPRATRSRLQGSARASTSVRSQLPSVQRFQCVHWIVGSSRTRSPASESRSPRSTSSIEAAAKPSSKPPWRRKAAPRTAPQPDQKVEASGFPRWCVQWCTRFL